MLDESERVAEGRVGGSLVMEGDTRQEREGCPFDELFASRAPLLYFSPGVRRAVEEVKAQSGDLLDNAVKANVTLTVERLKGSAILAEALEKSELRIVGGRYDLDTGMVEIIGRAD